MKIFGYTVRACAGFYADHKHSILYTFQWEKECIEENRWMCRAGYSVG